MKNAAESIAAVPEDERGEGRISVDVHESGGKIIIDVIDNGVGLPLENRSRLLEPYMTTREKGTGLGLAIVTKILEEHGGGIDLNDAPAGNWRAGRPRKPLVSFRAADPAVNSNQSRY